MDVYEKGRLVVKEAEAKAAREAFEERRARLEAARAHVRYTATTLDMARDNFANITPGRWRRWFRTHREIRRRVKIGKEFERKYGLR